MKHRPLPKLTDPEFEIMKVVWERGETGISDVMAEVNSHRTVPLKRTTIQVQVGRLEEKGWLTHRKEGKIFLYRANVTRSVATARIADDIRNRVFDGSFAELVKSLMQNEPITKEEIAELKDIIEAYDEEADQ